MPEIEIDSALRRRRRRHGRRHPSHGWRGFVTGRRFGRALFSVMCVILAIYAAAIVYSARAATYFYNNLQLGMTPEDVRYLYGTPSAIDAAGSRWSYTGEGRSFVAHFDAGRRVDSIACGSHGDARFGCPAIAGLRIGAPEDLVTLTLGPPSREVYGANTKTMYYEGLGLAFHMRLYLVEQMEVRRGATLPGYLSRALWMMLP